MKLYRLSEEAEKDYFAALDYIEAYNSAAGLKWEDRMLEAFDHLAHWPANGHIRAEFAPEYLRFWVVENYVILYDPSSDPLFIVAILHSARNIADIIASRIEEE